MVLLPGSCTQLAHDDLTASGHVAGLTKWSPDRPLYGLRESSTIIAKHLNDLPTTSPHGSYSEHDARNLGFTIDPNATRGTATAHRDGVNPLGVNPQAETNRLLP